MDTYLSNKKCVGEKGHIQNDWSLVYNKMKDEIKFQIVRSNNYISLERKWFEFLKLVYNKKVKYKDFEEDYVYFKDIKEIIQNTRSISKGKENNIYPLFYYLYCGIFIIY